MVTTTSFFATGWEHIVDINAYDHLLFVTTLCAAYQLVQWRQILVIITAFTVGHSVTLVLSSLGLIPTNPSIIEILVPLTIMGTAIANIVRHDEDLGARAIKLSYAIALLFGLIHGLAFASNFKVMMFGENILLPLFLFNLGIEAGQVFIVFLFMGALWLYNKFLSGEHLKWNLFVSGAGFGIAFTLLLNTVGSA
ncbi:MAG: HupE / UreJ protein [Myxococcales bacterium]|nr:HupE / UreJ protein [Myxococcales bacterium]|tara:strand:- start:1183 stop:1767 length:585 start_codon:yes stop_codon:yes gene_type:complete